jgi:hypothetical protein
MMGGMIQAFRRWFADPAYRLGVLASFLFAVVWCAFLFTIGGLR